MVASPSAFYKLDENSNDSIWTNNGTDTAITYVTGKLGKAASFNGTSSKIVVATNSAWKPSGSFSVCFWIKTTETVPALSSHGCVQSYAQVTWVGWWIIHRTSYIGDQTKIRFVVGDNTSLGGWYAQAYWPASVNNWVWHYIACVYNWSNLTVYQDWIAWTPVSWTTNPVYAPTTYQRIGNGNLNGTETDFSNSSLDEVGIWNSALSSGDITNLYNAYSLNWAWVTTFFFE